MLGISGDGKPDDGSIKSFKDCTNCPEMVHVAAGTAEIGAADTDRDATRSERPSHRMRIWPGFALSRTAVTSASYRAFLKDTERTPRVCDEVLASNDIKVVGLPDTDVYARCVTADDAEAYASWLTARTRKRDRLPTAVEWEYAMRTIGAPVLSSGDVADCWQDLLPRSGREIIASRSGAVDWLKGASTSDDAKWHRPSARRMLPHRAALIAVGFRVMREE
jgi:formylglycine-generating enzyme required for sulfatase activity